MGVSAGARASSERVCMTRYSGVRFWPLLVSRRMPAALALAAAVVAAGGASGVARQMPAPYGLYVRTDCELKSTYSEEAKSTTVQLALAPPGPGDLPSAASLVLQAQFAGRQPINPPGAISVLALPAANGNPNTVRGFELEFMIERADASPVRLFYFGQSWGDVGYVPAGGEVTRVVFSMSVADLQSLVLARKVTGTVMNSGFVFTDRHFAALRLFATAIGVPIPSDKSPER